MTATARRVVLATRKSALALAQARAFVAALVRARPGLEVVELLVTTSGDRIVDRPLVDVGGKGLFIKEIEEALLGGDADLAVHSAKDVPAEVAPGLAIGCVPRREDPRDALVSRSGAPLAMLPAGSRVGTSSLRRSVQLLALRPDLVIVPLRGNVDTRLRRCEEGAMDAVVLALAGLLRLGLAARATEILEPTTCIPAAGQGALAIELREADAELHALLAPVGDAEAAIAVAAERGVMAAVEGSCRIPLGAHATRQGGDLALLGMLAEPDGSRLRRAERREAWPGTENEAARIGRDLGAELRVK